MAFTVITLTNVPPSLRGDLTKWMQEIAIGVYVGQFNPKIREALWERVTKSLDKGEATLSYHCQSELAYEFKTINTKREIVEWDGIPLVKIPENKSVNTKLKPGFSQQSKYRKVKKFQGRSESVDPSYVIIDIETDGLDPLRNQIIEIGALRICGDKREEFSSLIRYEGNLPQKIVELTGIDENLLQSEGEEIEEVLEELIEFIGDSIIVGYNINFDLQFLNHNLKKHQLPEIHNSSIDVMKRVKREKDHLANFKLRTVLRAYGIYEDVAHRGLSDCKQIYALGIKVNVFS